ncbi:MAG: tripartite tricarboxylate transporter TctB family protein [Pseudomonadota bacterium]
MISNRVILVLTVLFAAAYFFGIRQIPTLDIGDPLGPRAFPYLITGGLVVSAGWLLAEMLQARKAATPQENSEPQDRRHLVLLAGVVSWIALYFAAFERLGFLLSTPLFLLALMAYLNRGKWVANVLTALLFTAGIYFLFSRVLGVSLAKGLLGI